MANTKNSNIAMSKNEVKNKVKDVESKNKVKDVENKNNDETDKINPIKQQMRIQILLGHFGLHYGYLD